jgi:signal transduction histidine kinase
MLANLIDNACKWCAGHVIISARADEGTGQAVITVEDDGSGLPPDARELVFRIGERLDERVPGSGLGLPIVRDLAQLYGGTVRLDQSEPGGVKAILTLPCISSGRNAGKIESLRNAWQSRRGAPPPEQTGSQEREARPAWSLLRHSDPAR